MFEVEFAFAGVEVSPPVTLEVDPAPSCSNTFDSETLTLQRRSDPTEARRKATVPVDDAMARHTSVVAGVERPADLAPSAWPPEQQRDLTVRRHPAAGYTTDERVDALVPRRSTPAGHRTGTRRHLPVDKSVSCYLRWYRTSVLTSGMPGFVPNGQGKGWARGRTAASDPRIARSSAARRGMTYQRHLSPEQDRRYRHGSARQLPLEWSDTMAYVVGLIATDGNLSRDSLHLAFDSGDLELIHTFPVMPWAYLCAHANEGERARRHGLSGAVQ